MLNENKKIPKVSIIVPVYKTKDTLATCMESLLSQTLREIEIILVDDGSPDESGHICDTYLKDERVKVIHKENGGLSSARNEGLKLAKGEYIGFVDSDDYVDEVMFEKMYDQITSFNADVCLCSHYTINLNGEIKEHHFEKLPDFIEQKDIAEKLIWPLIGADIKEKKPALDGFVWRNLYKHEIIVDERFKSERIFFAEDVIFNLDVYKKCKKICVLDECLYFYRYNSNSLSNQYRHGVSQMLENMLLWEKEYLQQSRLDENKYNRLYATGVKFVIFSIQNLKKEGCSYGYKEKIQEIKKILENQMFIESVQNAKISLYNLKMKIFIVLCRLKQYRLLLKLL